MVDSRSLKLVFGAGDVRERIIEHVAVRLRRAGYEDVTPPTLDFLGALECGTNVAADIARSLDVSRQMVGKTVKDLARRGYLEQVDGPGKQKRILFTERGERLMADVRCVLADLDEELGAAAGRERLDETIATLEAIEGVLEGGEEERSAVLRVVEG